MKTRKTLAAGTAALLVGTAAAVAIAFGAPTVALAAGDCNEGSAFYRPAVTGTAADWAYTAPIVTEDGVYPQTLTAQRCETLGLVTGADRLRADDSLLATAFDGFNAQPRSVAYVAAWVTGLDGYRNDGTGVIASPEADPVASPVSRFDVAGNGDIARFDLRDIAPGSTLVSLAIIGADRQSGVLDAGSWSAAPDGASIVVTASAGTASEGTSLGTATVRALGLGTDGRAYLIDQSVDLYAAGTGSPTTPEPPVIEPPVTEPPVVEPPVVEPPVVNPPVTEPPVIEPPVTVPPVAAPSDPSPSPTPTPAATVPQPTSTPTTTPVSPTPPPGGAKTGDDGIGLLGYGAALLLGGAVAFITRSRPFARR